MAQLAAAMEVAQRVPVPDGGKRITIKNTNQAEAYLRSQLQGLPEEHFRVLFLNRRGTLIEDALLAVGTVDQATTDTTSCSEGTAGQRKCSNPGS